jgi:hypothetical protein
MTIKANKPAEQNSILAVGGAVVLAQASAENASEPRKFSSVAYTGGALVVAGFPLPVVVDLKGVTTAKTIIANLDHVATQRVGQVTEIANDGKSLKLNGTLSASTPSRDEVIKSAADGFEWQMSIEAKPTTKLEMVPEGKKATANGQTFDGPILIARKSRLFGVAFVGQGADESTSATIAAGAANSLEEGDMDFESWIKAQGFDAATLSDKQQAVLKAAYDAQNKRGTTPVVAAPAFDLDSLKASVALHESNIEAALFAAEGKVAADKLATIKAKAVADGLKLKQDAISQQLSSLAYEVKATKLASDCQLELVRAERPVGPAIHGSTKDLTGEVIEAALSQRLNSAQAEKDYKPEVLQAAHSAFRGRLGLQQILILAASQNGMSFGPGERITEGNLRACLRHAFGDIRAGFSTISLPGIFSNVANKELAAGYMEVDQSWREIAAVKSVSNFRSVTTYRMLDNMEYEALGAGGQIKHGTVGEESYTRQAKTYAKMLALTREDIINDDLSAFDDLRNRLGRGAAQKFNKVFWTAFLDNASFFTTGRGNYITGATTTLLTDGVGMGLGVKAFRQMKSGAADGSKRIGGNPSILLVPPELEAAADKLFMGEKLNVGSSGGGDENIYRNKYRPVVCPWLSDADYSGYSTTAWYLLRSAAEYAAMVVSFLNGQQSPTVESAEADFNVLGVQFRGYHDFGCDKAEYVAGVKSKGAA